MSIGTFFSNVIHTSVQDRDVKLRPLILKTDIKHAIKKIMKVYKDNNYVNTWSHEEYGETYGEQYPYEVSCHLIEDGPNVICHVMVYNVEGRRKKKALLQFKELLRQSLADVIDSAK